MNKKFIYLHNRLMTLLDEGLAIYMSQYPFFYSNDWLGREQFAESKELAEKQSLNRLATHSVIDELIELTSKDSASYIAYQIFGGEQ